MNWPRLTRLILVIVIITGTAGCLGGFPNLHTDQPWTMAIYIEEEQHTESGIRITAKVALDGTYKDDTRISDVRVCAVNNHDNVVESIFVGDISGDDPEENVTFRFREPPNKFSLGYEKIYTETSYEIEGVKRLGEREYSSFTQQTSQCNRS